MVGRRCVPVRAIPGVHCAIPVVRITSTVRVYCDGPSTYLSTRSSLRRRCVFSPHRAQDFCLQAETPGQFPVNAAAQVAVSSSVKSEDTSIPPGAVLGANGDAAVGSSSIAEEEGEEEEEDEDEDALHCLCQLPAGTARFRTLMTCDLCHNWFHPACVRLKARCTIPTYGRCC